MRWAIPLVVIFHNIFVNGVLEFESVFHICYDLALLALVGANLDMWLSWLHFRVCYLVVMLCDLVGSNHGPVMCCTTVNLSCLIDYFSRSIKSNLEILV